MAKKIHTEPSRTLLEYRLLPGYTGPEAVHNRVSLATPLVANVPLAPLTVPIVAAAMQSVSGVRLAATLSNLGGLAFLYCSQPIEEQAAMVAAVKAAPVTSDVALVDPHGRLLCAAALNTHDHQERLPALVEAGVDLICLDSSDGHSFYQGRALAWVREHFGALGLIGGNVITGNGFDYLVAHGAGAVKVGMGGGSICITQEQKGTGRGLATSIIDVARARDAHRERTGNHIPLIADGGLGSAKDVVIALALGADYAMMGRFFAGVDESPNPVVAMDNQPLKAYWGEGSARAQAWKSHRYHQGSFVEGIEGYVPAAGPVGPLVDDTVAKIKAAMSSCGCPSIASLHREAELEVVSALSIKEGQVHDILIPPHPAATGGGQQGH